MRIGINAQLFPNSGWGGVEQFLTGLISALGKLDGAEEYVVIGHRKQGKWLRPYLGANQQLVAGPSSIRTAFVEALGPLGKSVYEFQKKMRNVRQRVSPQVPESNGFFESLGLDVIHFPYQTLARCDLPFIFNPHDLQHIHFPQFFPKEELARRETIYRLGCRHARAVVADSRWVKTDLIRHYGVDPQRVFAIPMAPPPELYRATTDRDAEDVKRKFDLPETFALYPAHTWQHKNHLRLLEAIALLRDRDGIPLNLICTGKQNDFWRTIARRIRELRLEQQTRFLGFVKPDELRALYRLAQFVIHPSLFEGGGLPVLEAFRAGVPVACSNVTSLPEYAGHAALLFDPTDVASIADALRQMATNVALREELRQRGSERIRLFTWERTAKMYRALYRQVAGVPLSEEDSALLAEA